MYTHSVEQGGTPQYVYTFIRARWDTIVCIHIQQSKVGHHSMYTHSVEQSGKPTYVYTISRARWETNVCIHIQQSKVGDHSMYTHSVEQGGHHSMHTHSVEQSVTPQYVYTFSRAKWETNVCIHIQQSKVGHHSMYTHSVEQGGHHSMYTHSVEQGGTPQYVHTFSRAKWAPFVSSQKQPKQMPTCFPKSSVVLPLCPSCKALCYLCVLHCIRYSIDTNLSVLQCLPLYKRVEMSLRRYDVYFSFQLNSFIPIYIDLYTKSCLSKCTRDV